MTSQPPIRIGNRERESACRALDEHLAEGRLDLDEYADRYAKASLARHQNELDELFLDLPHPHAGPASAPAPASPVSLRKKKATAPAPQHRDLPPVPRIAVTVAVIAIAVAAVSALGAWWVIWVVFPMLYWGGPFRYGPCGRSRHYTRRERVSATPR